MTMQVRVKSAQFAFFKDSFNLSIYMVENIEDTRQPYLTTILMLSSFK